MIASNIKSGVNIFGVIGSMVGISSASTGSEVFDNDRTNITFSVPGRVVAIFNTAKDKYNDDTLKGYCGLTWFVGYGYFASRRTGSNGAFKPTTNITHVENAGDNVIVSYTLNADMRSGSISVDSTYEGELFHVVYIYKVMNNTVPLLQTYWSIPF